MPNATSQYASERPHTTSLWNMLGHIGPVARRPVLAVLGTPGHAADPAVGTTAAAEPSGETLMRRS